MCSGGSRPSDKGGGGSHPDPEIRVGGPVLKNVLSHTLGRGDWPVYEVAASESGSYFMASINFGFTIELLLQYRLCKENGDFRRESCKSSQKHALS